MVISETSAVDLSSSMKRLPQGGIIVRIACGRMIRSREPRAEVHCSPRSFTRKAMDCGLRRPYPWLLWSP